MKNKRLLTLAAGICLILTLIVLPFMAACAKPAPPPAPAPAPAPAPTPPPVEPIEVQVLTFAIEGHPSFPSMQLFVEEVNTNSKGRLHLTLYGGFSLMGQMESADAVRAGVLDILHTHPGAWTGVAPTVGICSVPGYITSFEQNQRWLTGEWGDIVAKAYHDEVGVHMLSNNMLISTNTPTSTTKPVEKFADWQGMKINVSGKVAGVYVTALGATPVMLPRAEVYMGMERGTIDGCDDAVSSRYLRKHYEVAPYYYYEGFTYSLSLCHVTSLKLWDSLPSDLQDIVSEAAAKAEADLLKRASDLEREHLADFEKRGMAPVDLTKLDPEGYALYQERLVAETEKWLREDLGDELAEKCIATAKASK